MKAGGGLTMALTLAACGGSSSDETTTVSVTATDAGLTGTYADAAALIAAIAETDNAALVAAKEAAEAAKTAAEAAEAAAEAKATAAEAAQTAAEAGEATAVTAKEAAETAQAAAEVAKTVAETAQAAAETAHATQNAAITAAGFDDIGALVAAYDALANPAALNFVLTTSADIPDMTSSDDVITGATATLASTDTIADASAADNDVVNITLTSAISAGNTNKATISGVENVNLIWDAFGTATADVENITGATITGSSSKVGFLGSMTVSNAAANTIVAGDGMVGTMTVTGVEDGVITGTSAAIMDVTGTESVTVNAGTDTTNITTTGFTTQVVNASTAATISVTDAGVATDTTTLNVNADATITNALTGAMTLDLTDGNSVTMNAIGASLDVTGTGDVTINSTGLTAETATNSKTDGTVTYFSTATGAQDVSDIAADNFTFSGAVTAALTFSDNNSVTLSGNVNGADLTIGGTATDDVLNVEVTATTLTNLVLSGTDTVNLTADATTGTGTDMTVTTFDTDGNTVVVDGTNDVELGNVTNGGTIDASFLVGALTVTQAAVETSDLTVTGGSDDLTVTGTAALGETLEVTGGAGDDAVTSVLTTGSLVAVLGDGTNTVAADAASTGTVVVISGSGTDTVGLDGLTTGTVNLQLGNGSNTVSVGATTANVLGANNFTYAGGAGIDTIAIEDDATGGTYVLDFGGGSADVLDLSGVANAGVDISGATSIALTGLEEIAIGSATTAAVVDASLLTGESFKITGDGTAADMLSVTTATAGTYEFSNIVIDNTITEGLAGLNITGNAGNDVITGTDGADTIDTGNGVNTVTGGTGLDQITLGTGIDTVVIGSRDTGTTLATSDQITGCSTADFLDFTGGAATALNYVEAASTFDAAAGGGAATTAVATQADVLAQGNALLDGTIIYAVVDNANADGGTAVAATGSYVFLDEDADGTADQIVFLTDGVLTDISAADIIA